MPKKTRRKPPVISIIVPAYNEEKHISLCLRSILRQKTTTPYEVIVVDNNSTDTTARIARMLGVRVVVEKRQGRAFARQTGADNAHGSILAFTEADCIVKPTWISYIARYFTTHPKIAGLAGNYTFIKSTPFLTLIGPVTVDLSSPLYKLFTGNHVFRAANFAIRTSVFRTIKGFNKDAVPYDDVELGMRAGKHGAIHYKRNFTVATSDRRFRGRLHKFAWEFLTSYPRIFLFKQKGHDDLYDVVR